MKHNITENILYDYFAGRATPLQKKMIQEWLAQEGSENIFYYHLAIWEAGRPQYQPDQQESLVHYQAFLAGEQNYPFNSQKPTQSKFSFFFNLRYLSLAASVIVLLGLGVFFSKDYFLYDTYSTGNGNLQTVGLADGSQVTLNANSEIKIPKNLSDSDLREVWLQGEAYFSVAKRPAKTRFVVHTDNLDIEVLGTKFNVQNRRGKTEVVLNEGKIKLTSILNGSTKTQSAYMRPGQLATVDQRDTTFKVKAVNVDRYNAWQSNKLAFDEATLGEVAKTLEDYYGVKIVISNEKALNRLLTGTLPNDDLSAVMKAIAASHNLEIIQTKNQIIWR
jgi:transmembrane sensor